MAEAACAVRGGMGTKREGCIDKFGFPNAEQKISINVTGEAPQFTAHNSL